MLKKYILMGMLLIFPFCSLFPKVYYVATSGNDSNSGSITEPFATIQRAQKDVVAGDTVYVRGGTYKMTESQIAYQYQIWSYVTYLDKSGTSGKRINYWAYPGERPIFDLSNIKPAGYRIIAFQIMGSWIYIKGLEVTGVQVTILTHTQSECFDNQGSNNIYEQLSMHDGQAIGFYLTKGSNNLVLNCDAYRNWDYTSENGKGGNTDGFGCHPSKGGTGNIIRGCRAWFNSDDGYDCINAYESVTFENSWSFFNGYSTSFASLGDGNGFKAGGYGQAPVVSELPNPIPAHTVRFCMAYRNKANGFYSNHHVSTGSYFYNNTAYRNSTNYNMLSQKITKSPTTSNDTTLDVPGFNHTLHNNVSYKYGTSATSYRDSLNLGTCDITSNSFTPLSGIIVDANDFMSIDESLLTAPRQADGSLPENNFLKLKSGSDLIDKGIDLGFPYNGAAPDLGAFEFKNPQSIIFDSISNKKYNDPIFKLVASASSGLPLTFTSSNPTVALIAHDTVTITGAGAGTAVITASQFGTNNYYAAPEVTRTLIVNKISQDITFNSLTNKSTNDPSFTLNATASSKLPVTYTSSNTSVSKINGDTVIIVGAGTTTITASQAGDSNYLPADNIAQILTITSTTEIKPLQCYNGNLIICPNPATGNSAELKFHLNTSTSVKIEILNYQGNVINVINLGQLESGEITQNVNLSNIRKGFYIIRLLTQEGNQTIKFIRL